jgi:hypothetical protein
MELQVPENDLQQLPQMIIQWKQTQEEVKNLKEQIRDLNIREKAYRDVIMRVMKKNSIGTLDLQQSQRRIVYNTKEKKKGISAKQLVGQLGEYLKSEEEGKKAVDFLLGKRQTTSVETLVLEKL